MVSRREAGRGEAALLALLDSGPSEPLVEELSGANPPAEAAASRRGRSRRRGGSRLARGVATAAMLAGLLGGVTSSASRGLVNPHLALTAAASALAGPSALSFEHGSGAERELARVTDSAARELAGSGDASPVSFDSMTGLWDRMKPPVGMPPSWRPPMWWQSALALRSLVRYLTQVRDTQPAYQQLIGDVYRLNISKPGTEEPTGFENKFMDDTAWWGLAWLDVARYEVLVQRDFSAAAGYLRLAEQDASYIYSRPRKCGTGGIEFRSGYAPNTITNAEFVSLAAQLAQIHRATGLFHDPRSAQAWLTEAERTLNWLEGSGLVNMRAGTVANTYDRNCRPAGAAMTYTEGEMADALTQVGTASRNPAYYDQAAAFINRVANPHSGMLTGNVLQEPCESRLSLCAGHSYNITVFKGLLVDAVSDWSKATGSTTYYGLLLAQARAVISNSTGARGTSPNCRTPASCQLSLYWGRRVTTRRAPIPPTPGSQTAGLAALSDALGVSQRATP